MRSPFAASGIAGAVGRDSSTCDWIYGNARSEGAGNHTINLELQILACAMGYTWKALWPRVKRLEEYHDFGRALEPGEEQAILDEAARNQSRLIYPFLFTLAWTGMRSDEARTVR